MKFKFSEIQGNCSLESDTPNIKRFFSFVAHGMQNEAEQLLKTNVNAEFLLAELNFKDESDRVFNCTIYEYTYWNKDTHMRRMLEQYMDDEIRLKLAERIESIEKNGLVYYQNGNYIRGERNFDFTRLINAIKNSLEDSDEEYGVRMTEVGAFQRDLPAHVLNEYCRLDRSFDPTPEFKDEYLPRELNFHNWQTHQLESVFPLSSSTSMTGLGNDFGLYRGCHDEAGAHANYFAPKFMLEIDLLALCRLDKVRTQELKDSLDFLNQTRLSHLP